MTCNESKEEKEGVVPGDGKPAMKRRHPSSPALGISRSWKGTLNPTPYTLNPTPYTLHPTPYTLNPTPCTPHPTPYTLNPQP